MNLRNKWLIDLDKNRVKYENISFFLCDKLKEHFSQQNIRAIITYRVKGYSSTEGKIIRNKLDCEKNSERKLTDIVEDIIGIRVVCMKVRDESTIIRTLKSNDMFFKQSSISFRDEIDNQPTNQKNGKEIYKFHGDILYEQTKYPFEIQVKALANLFWGEMEHLLFYKNNKVLISGKYYQKEMHSIYDELTIIDNKLTYMEDVMMNESDDKLLEEKIEILKRFSYLQLREVLGHGVKDNSDLRFVFEAVADYVFRRDIFETDQNGNRVQKNANDIMRKILYHLLYPSYTYDRLFETQYNSMNQEGHSLPKEITDYLLQLVLDKESGWWYYLTLCGLFSCYQNDSSQLGNLDLHEITHSSHIAFTKILDFVFREYYLFTILVNESAEYNNETIKKFSINLVLHCLADQEKSRSLRFTTVSCSKLFGQNSVQLLRSIENNGYDILERFCDNQTFIKCFYQIVFPSDNESLNIQTYINDMNALVYKEFNINLDFIENIKSEKGRVIYTRSLSEERS